MEVRINTEFDIVLLELKNKSKIIYQNAFRNKAFFYVTFTKIKRQCSKLDIGAKDMNQEYFGFVSKALLYK
jgi:hypothetical protein